MSWIIDSISVVKTGPSTGEASVKFFDGEEAYLSVNKIIINLNDGSSPVTVWKYEGTPIVSGNFMEGVKELLLDVFQEGLKDEEPGLYEIRDGVLKRQ